MSEGETGENDSVCVTRLNQTVMLTDDWLELRKCYFVTRSHRIVPQIKCSPHLKAWLLIREHVNNMNGL